MFCLIVSITINVISVRLNIKAGGIIRQYEDFYEATLDDCVEMVEYVENLLNNNYILAEDSDVDNLRKSMKMFYDILVGYIYALPNNKNRKEGKEGKEEGG